MNENIKFRIKECFKKLLLREEKEICHDDPFCLARWIDIKINLLSCNDTLSELESLFNSFHQEVITR